MRWLLPDCGRCESYRRETVPVYLALRDLTVHLRFHPATHDVHKLHRAYQRSTARFLATIESSVAEQLSWGHTFTHDYWQSFLSFNQSLPDSCLVDYGVDRDHVYLNLHGNIPYHLSWFEMRSQHPLLACFPCPPQRAAFWTAGLPDPPPSTPSLVEQETVTGPRVGHASEYEACDEGEASDGHVERDDQQSDAYDGSEAGESDRGGLVVVEPTDLASDRG